MGILHILLQRRQVTAPYLAEKFEVSRRTIQRDIEDLCKAGFPITTMQGMGGGISIQPGFKLDNRIFTASELQAVLAGLQGVESVSGAGYTGAVRDKISAGPAADGQTMRIDLASYYKDTLTEKIRLLQQAVTDRRTVSFRYYYNKGESVRTVEPYLLAFQWSSWYLLAYCLERQDFRLFKLNRLWELDAPGRAYIPREIPSEKLEFNRYYTDHIPLKALFSPEAKYKLVEAYGPDSLEELADGRILLQWDYTDREELVGWILRFGGQAEVLEPQWLRRELFHHAQKLLALYNDET